MSPIARVAVVAVALVAVAWFALGIHQSADLSAASAIASRPHPTAAAARHADALLDSAATLNPDRTVDITRAQLALARGDDARARAILLGVTRAEPQDLDAWIGLVRSGGPRKLRELAFARALALSHTSVLSGG
jgi:predicted Zn-dependent protease